MSQEPMKRGLAALTVNQLTDYFKYLDDLRESGTINMFGARVPLAREFGLDKAESAKVHAAWMETFSKEDAEDRAAQVLS